MPVEALTPIAFFTVAGIGPYGIGFSYDVDALNVVVVKDGVRITPTSDDFNVTPSSSSTEGDVYLTPSAAALYAGAQLIVERVTPAEQGWSGVEGERERGLERQLDRLVRGQQELRNGLNSAFRLDTPISPGQSTLGAVLVFTEGGFAPGPVAGDIFIARENALASADLSQKWAESDAAPGGVGTKSSKTHAAEAKKFALSAWAAVASTPIEFPSGAAFVTSEAIGYAAPFVMVVAEGDYIRLTDAVAICKVKAEGATSDIVGSPVPVSLEDNAVLNILAFGALGTTDDSGLFQHALDKAEAYGVPLLIPKGRVVNINGTVYLGNIDLRCAGAVFNVLLNGSFTKRGNALRAKAGAILTKSAPGCDYGYATVSIKFDAIEMIVTRSIARDISGTELNDGIASVKSGMTIENTTAFVGQTFRQKIVTIGFSGDNTGGLDFWGGVQGVRMDCYFDENQNPRGLEGFWVRNGSTTRATRDIAIENLYFTGAHDDEAIAVFNFAANGESDAVLGATVILEDIHFGAIYFEGVTDSGNQIVSIFNKGDYNPQNMQNITVGSITGKMIGALAPTGEGGVKRSFIPVRVAKCAPHIGSVELEFDVTWDHTILQFAWVMRCELGVGQTERPRVEAAHIRISSTNTPPAYDVSHKAYIVEGRWDIGKLTITGSGAGWNQGIAGATVETGAILSTPFSEWAAKDSVFIGCDVIGRMSGVSKFTGKHTCDPVAFPNNTFFYHPSDTPAKFVTYHPSSVEVLAAGVGTDQDKVSSIVSIQKASAGLIVDVDYGLIVPAGVTVGNDAFTTQSTPANYRAVKNVDGAISAIRGATKFISSGAITVTQPWHLVDTEGLAATDDLDTINGVPKYKTVRLEGVTTTRLITVTNVNNIVTTRPFVFQGAGSFLELYNDGTSLREIARSEPKRRALYSSGAILEVSAGSAIAAVTAEFHVVNATGGTGTSTLTTLPAPIATGQVLKLMVGPTSTITVNHGTANIRANGGANVTYAANNIITFFGFKDSNLWLLEK